MTHRTVNIDGIKMEVFDTAFAAHRWIKRNKSECIVIARGSFYFQRKDGSEMTIRLNATRTPETNHIFSAANTLADLAEQQIMKAA